MLAPDVMELFGFGDKDSLTLHSVSCSGTLTLVGFSGRSHQSKVGTVSDGDIGEQPKSHQKEPTGMADLFGNPSDVCWSAFCILFC